MILLLKQMLLLLWHKFLSAGLLILLAHWPISMTVGSVLCSQFSTLEPSSLSFSSGLHICHKKYGKNLYILTYTTNVSLEIIIFWRTLRSYYFRKLWRTSFISVSGFLFLPWWILQVAAVGKSLHKKWSFLWRISPVNVTNSAGNRQETIFTEGIFNGKLHFLCSECVNRSSENYWKRKSKFTWNVSKILEKSSCKPAHIWSYLSFES